MVAPMIQKAIQLLEQRVDKVAWMKMSAVDGSIYHKCVVDHANSAGLF